MARGHREPRREHLALLAIHRRTDPVPVLYRSGAPALRELVLGLRDGERPDQPGLAGAVAADRGRDQQRGGGCGARLRESNRHRDDRYRDRRDDPLHAAAAEDRTVAVATRSVQRTRRIKLQVFRIVVFALAAVFFLIPLAAMVEFSTRGINGERTLEYWTSIVQYPDMIKAIVASVQLALITSVAMLVLLVPTMVWVRLKLPQLSRIVEFVCLLPPGRAGAPRPGQRRRVDRRRRGLADVRVRPVGRHRICRRPAPPHTVGSGHEPRQGPRAGIGGMIQRSGVKSGSRTSSGGTA